MHNNAAMTDRERVNIQLHKQRIVQAQLDQIERELQEAKVELTLVCPTKEAIDKLAQYGYYHTGDGEFRFGESRSKRDKTARIHQGASNAAMFCVAVACTIGGLLGLGLVAYYAGGVPVMAAFVLFLMYSK